MTGIRSLCLPLFLFATMAAPAIAQPMATLENPENVIWATFSPDGKALAVTMEGKHVYLWDLPTGTVRKKLPTEAMFAAFSPNGEYLATTEMPDDQSSTSRIRIWDVASGTMRKELSHDQSDGVFTVVTFSPDGRLLASSSWNISIGISLEFPVLDAIGALLRLIFGGSAKDGEPASGGEPAAAPDADGPAEGATEQGDDAGVTVPDFMVWIWDSSTWKLHKKFPQDGDGLLAFLPDGSLTVQETDRVVVYETRDFRERLAFATPAGETCFLFAASPVGGRLAIGYESEQRGGIIRLFDTAKGDRLLEIAAHPKSIYWLTYSPDGKLLLSSGGEKTTRLWDADNGKQVAELTCEHGESTLAAFSPDGHTLATWTGKDGRVVLRDLKNIIGANK